MNEFPLYVLIVWLIVTNLWLIAKYEKQKDEYAKKIENIDRELLQMIDDFLSLYITSSKGDDVQGIVESLIDASNSMKGEE